MTNGSLMKVESIAECSLWSILQYFWPALSDDWSWIKLYFICIIYDKYTKQHRIQHYNTIYHYTNGIQKKVKWLIFLEQLVLKTNFRSFWEWLFYTGFTVLLNTLPTGDVCWWSLQIVRIHSESIAPWENFYAFLSSADFFHNQFFWKILAGIPSECQTGSRSGPTFRVQSAC